MGEGVSGPGGMCTRPVIIVRTWPYTSTVQVLGYGFASNCSDPGGLRYCHDHPFATRTAHLPLHLTALFAVITNLISSR